MLRAGLADTIFKAELDRRQTVRESSAMSSTSHGSEVSSGGESDDTESTPTADSTDDEMQSALNEDEVKVGQHSSRLSNIKRTFKLRVGMLEGTMFLNQYIVIETLGRGAHGKVKLCLNTSDDTLYAVKVINRRQVRPGVCVCACVWGGRGVRVEGGERGGRGAHVHRPCCARVRACVCSSPHAAIIVMHRRRCGSRAAALRGGPAAARTAATASWTT